MERSPVPAGYYRSRSAPTSPLATGTCLGEGAGDSPPAAVRPGGPVAGDEAGVGVVRLLEPDDEVAAAARTIAGLTEDLTGGLDEGIAARAAKANGVAHGHSSGDGVRGLPARRRGTARWGRSRWLRCGVGCCSGRARAARSGLRADAGASPSLATSGRVGTMTVLGRRDGRGGPSGPPLGRGTALCYRPGPGVSTGNKIRCRSAVRHSTKVISRLPGRAIARLGMIVSDSRWGSDGVRPGV
jgi:hypothetical protein